MKLALLHPGEMGVSIGMAMAASGHTVGWLSEGRGPQTHARASAAGFSAHATLDELLEGSAGVVSVCPPHAAVEVARGVIAGGYTGLYVDANAIAPNTARSIGDSVGENYVDGGIVGPPALQAGSTRLYLSGLHAEDVQAWFVQGFVETLVIGTDRAQASALKMCYAAYTKGTSALLLAIRALAEAEGVTEGLLGEWQRSQPGLPERSERAAHGTSKKAWRFVGEMQEIAASFEGAELPGGFHEAAADVFRRMADLKDVDQPTLALVLERLLGSSAKA